MMDSLMNPPHFAKPQFYAQRSPSIAFVASDLRRFYLSPVEPA
ncbi:unnamed protein product [Amoebophrya sp. A25]|nr:unnamed protein product [Amoebophrya sp. A25]|eukprot:GSA25T00004541001.1